jgi:hypothetical protein
MVSLVQKEDLAPASFTNDNTLAAQGIVVRTDAGSTVGQAISVVEAVAVAAAATATTAGNTAAAAAAAADAAAADAATASAAAQAVKPTSMSHAWDSSGDGSGTLTLTFPDSSTLTCALSALPSPASC